MGTWNLHATRPRQRSSTTSSRSPLSALCSGAPTLYPSHTLPRQSSRRVARGNLLLVASCRVRRLGRPGSVGPLVGGSDILPATCFLNLTPRWGGPGLFDVGTGSALANAAGCESVGLRYARISA